MRRRDPVNLAGLREHIRHRYEEVEGVAWDPDGPGAIAGRFRRGLPADPIGHALDVLRGVNIPMTAPVSEQLDAIRALTREAVRFCRTEEVASALAELVAGWKNPTLLERGIVALGQIAESPVPILNTFVEHPKFGEVAKTAIAEIQARCETVDVERDGYRRQRAAEDPMFAELEIYKLKRQPAEVAVPRLIPHLFGSHPGTIKAALAALGHHGADAIEAVEHIEGMAARESDRDIKHAARNAVRMIRGT